MANPPNEQTSHCVPTRRQTILVIVFGLSVLLHLTFGLAERRLAITYTATRINGLFIEDGTVFIGSIGHPQWIEASPGQWDCELGQGYKISSVRPWDHLSRLVGFGVLWSDKIGSQNVFAFRPSGHLLIVSPTRIALICAAMLIVPIYHRRAQELARKLRGNTGFCNVCGYDLRATPDRCPECGTVITNRNPNRTIHP